MTASVNRFWESVSKSTSRTRWVLAAMTALQVLWLGVIWATGAASNARKIPFLIVYTLIVGTLAQVLPLRVESWWNRWIEALAPRRRRVIAGLVLVGGIAGCIYAHYQNVLTDEGYLLQASGIIADRGVRAFFSGYSEIKWLGGQHPPLIPLIYGSAMRIVGTRLLPLRAIAVLVTTGTVVLTYRLGEAWFDPVTGLLAAFLFVSMPYCLRMGTAVLTDMPVTFLFLLGVFLIQQLPARRSFGLASLAGVVIGLGLLSKYTMFLIYPVLALHCIAQKRMRQVPAQLALSILVSLLVFGAWMTFAYARGIFGRQVETVTHYAGMVVRGGWMYMVEMLSTELTSAVGLYNLPVLFLGVIASLRQRLESDLSLLLWIVAVFAAVTLTLPDPRYFMPMFPALAIAMARGTRTFRLSESRIIMLALLLAGGALCLFADWYRAAFLFLQ